MLILKGEGVVRASSRRSDRRLEAPTDREVKNMRAKASIRALVLSVTLAGGGVGIPLVAPPASAHGLSHQAPTVRTGNPGTNSILAVAGTVDVSTLPSASVRLGPNRPGEPAPPAAPGLDPGHAPRAAGSAAAPTRTNAPTQANASTETNAPTQRNAPTQANAMEQEVNIGGIAQDGVAPPDTQIARGAGDIVEAVNVDIRISVRWGGVIQTFTLASFYGGVTTDPGLSDPRVVFDDLSGRWFTSIVTKTNNPNSTQNSIFMAVSSTSDPTGVWTIYKVEGPVPANRLADQPRLGFSSDKVVIAYENFDESGTCFPSSSCHDDIVWVLQMSDLTAGGAVHATRFDTTSGLAHPFGIVPAIPLASAETTTAYAAYNETHAFGHNVAILVITGLPSTGTTYSDIETGMSLGSDTPPLGRQPGGLQNIDTGDDRFLSASVSQATGGLGAQIWIAGGDKCSIGGVDEACIHAFSVNVDSTGSTLTKTWEQKIGFANADLYYPAIVGDSLGTHAFITYTVSSPTEFPTSEVLSMFPSDESQNARDDYASGTQAYTQCPCRTNTTNPRWGDYSGIYPDSSDGTSVWVATEFGAVAGGAWATQVAEYTIDGPVVTGLSPASGVAGTIVTVNGANFTSSSFVAFGGVPAGTATFVGSNELIVTAPPQPAGTVNVTVTTLKGTSPTGTLADEYTYPAILWASLPADHEVTMIDTSTSALIVPPLQLGSGTPAGIAARPDDTEAVVVDSTNDALLPIFTISRSEGASAPAGPSPLNVAISPDGALAYVTNPTTLTPFKFMPDGSLQPLAPIPVSGAVRLTGIALTSDGKEALVTDPTASKVWIISLNGKGGGKVVGSKAMDFPTGIAVSGTVAFVTIDPGPTAAGIVITFDTTTNGNLDSVQVGRDPRQVVASPLGDFVYVSNAGDGTVTTIQHAGPGSDSVLSTPPVGSSPLGLAMTPDGSTAYVALSGTGQIGTFPSPPGPVSAFSSGGTDPEQLAISMPSPVICQSDGLTKLVMSLTPATAAHGSTYTEADHVGFCSQTGQTLTVTVKSRFISVPAGASTPVVPPATWTLENGENARYVQRVVPSTPGNYTLRVRLFSPTNTLLDTATFTIAVT
jgi:DNA-binding beta-propeller fold protein YncE